MNVSNLQTHPQVSLLIVILWTKLTNENQIDKQKTYLGNFETLENYCDSASYIQLPK
jgi:hypothetical protein